MVCMSVKMKQVNQYLPILKVEVSCNFRLNERIMLRETVKFIRNYKNAQIIPWNENLYPEMVNESYPISICCFVKFSSVKEIREFTEIAEDYEFFQN